MSLVDVPCWKQEINVDVPADKSISHRALLMGAIADGRTVVRNILHADDTVTTLGMLRKCGVKIHYDRKRAQVIVDGQGRFLPGPGGVLYMKESGTTIRLSAGLFAGQKFPVTLRAASSLGLRPMSRVTDPLRLMGADILGRVEHGKEYPPLRIRPVSALHGIEYKMPVASAQVKSCLLLAGLYADGNTSVVEPVRSRDHTERMMALFGADIDCRGRSIRLSPSSLRTPGVVDVPGDISSAAFFLALGTLLSGKRSLIVHNVGVNPTRDGFLRILRKMGALCRCRPHGDQIYEPSADIVVRPSTLHGVLVEEHALPAMIDELPLLFVLGAFASGKTVIRGVRELRVKETDRIESMAYNLRAMGAEIDVRSYRERDGTENHEVVITGGRPLHPAPIRSFGDHRTAMAMIVAHFAIGAPAEVDNTACISKSFPGFIRELRKLGV
jgi:3-phosphoshikimate 1-carboxyvinyltransferase